MTYIVLARKWRPKKFEEIIGQAHITRTLQNALKQNRLGHAFIFAGPRGIGKTSTARLLAKAVNSDDPANFDNLELDGNEASIDIIEIDGASNRGIDEIRNLRENVRFAPAASKYKIYIIDEVHMLSKEAFNALLKTLEEPPSHAIFIFATTEIHKVPLTILSRCQRFDFKRIPMLEIADQLEKIAKAENIKIDRESLLIISRKSDGGMRDATSLLDQMSSFSEGAITSEIVQSTLGLMPDELFFEFTELVQQKNDSAVVLYAQSVFQQGHDLINFMQGLQNHFRNLMLVKSIGNTNLLEISDDRKAQYSTQVKNFTTKDLLHYLELLIQNESVMKFSENPQLILELLLLKLANKPTVLEIEELIKLLKNPPAANLSETATAPQQPTPTQPQTPKTPPASPKVPTKPNSPSPVTPSDVPKSFSPQKSAQPVLNGSANGAPVEAEKRFGRLKPFGKKATVAEEAPKPVELEIAPITNPIIDTASVAQLAKEWGSLIQALKLAKRAPLAGNLQSAVPFQIKDGILEIAFEADQGWAQSQVQQNKSVIEKTLKEKFNLPLPITCVTADFKSKGLEKKFKTAGEKLEIMKSQEPALKKLIEMFDCENLSD